MTYKITEGVYTLNTEGVYAKYARHAIPGTFPRRFWDIEEVDAEPPVKKPRPRLPVFDTAPVEFACERCKRVVTARRRYTHCYRCFQFLQKKARIAKEFYA